MVGNAERGTPAALRSALRGVRRMFRPPTPKITATVRLPAGPPIMSLAELEAQAAGFPSMGGLELAPFLRGLGRAAPADAAIVEVGVWLGAGTAQLACALAQRAREGAAVPVLYCYDRWLAQKSEVQKTASRNTWALKRGQNTLPRVVEALSPFGVEICFRQGEIIEAQWADGPIGVYIDDASKKPKLFRTVMRKFGPHWIPGKTVVLLMDYSFYLSTGNEEHSCQARFVEAHADHFEPIDLDVREPGCAAAFRYVKEVDFEAAIARGVL
ncbi:MAG: hypothetical protein HXY25_02335 [Alphaproteobacteria bacterium]|nr:hypothetical protein [Alphaproteobacteria bacterium]